MNTETYPNIINPNIDTPAELISQTHAKIIEYLKNFSPDYLLFDDDRITISRGSTQIMIIVRPFTADESCVECSAHVVFGAKVDENLMNFLLRKNAELHFGAFGLLFDGTITFSQSIPGTHLDESELKVMLNSVAVIADYYDDIIVEMAGGKRCIDLNTDEM